MLDHLALQTDDAAAAATFYARVFAALGVQESMRIERPEGLVIGMAGPDGFPHLWFGPLVDPGIRPVHLALTAPSREAVDRWPRQPSTRTPRFCIRRGSGRNITRVTTQWTFAVFVAEVALA